MRLYTPGYIPPREARELYTHPGIYHPGRLEDLIHPGIYHPGRLEASQDPKNKGE